MNMISADIVAGNKENEEPSPGEADGRRILFPRYQPPGSISISDN
jgi:hypothetical protein